MTPERRWLNFYDAAKGVRKRLRVSGGVAQRMLREACAKGDVRSLREPYDPTTGQGEGPPELVKPSQWKQDDIDLMTDDVGCKYFVDVDEEDFDFWLDSMPKAKDKETRAAPMDNLARKTIAKLNLPDDMSNTEVHDRIGKQLKAERRRVPSLSVIKRIRTKKPMN
jgi:hypothetical protein